MRILRYAFCKSQIALLIDIMSISRADTSFYCEFYLTVTNSIVHISVKKKKLISHGTWGCIFKASFSFNPKPPGLEFDSHF